MSGKLSQGQISGGFVWEYLSGGANVDIDYHCDRRMKSLTQWTEYAANSGVSKTQKVGIGYFGANINVGAKIRGVCKHFTVVNLQTCRATTPVVNGTL